MSNDKEMVQSVSHAFELLAELLKKPRQTASQLSRSLGCSRTAVYRLLWTMEKHHAVAANERREYSLGPFFFSPGMGRVLENSLVDLSMMTLQRLREQTKESVGIYFARSTEIICGEIFDSPYELRRITRPGYSLPLTRGATGKCYLTWRITEVSHPYDFLASIGGVLPEQFDSWFGRLHQIRADGYCVSWEERVPGGVAIAAPVFRPDGKLAAVISISGPIGRITPETIGALSQKICAAAREMESRLQYER